MHVPTHSFPMDFFANLDKMENLRFKPRKSVDEVVENWDDDDFMIGEEEDLTFRSHSTTATSTNNNTQNIRLRDSRRSSIRSDHELPQSEEQHVHLPGDDEKSTLDAIAAATHAGIPIPTNVPPSALIGGTIKRLGGRKIKQIFEEDWGDELELPASGQALRLKAQDGVTFPDALRQVSGSTNPSPARKLLPAITQFSPPRLGKPLALGAPINLERFRDSDDDNDFFGDGTATIKVSKLQDRGRPISLITPPTPSPSTKKRREVDEESFENDLELPSDGKLQLSSRRDIPKPPSLYLSDDFDWGEGSLGTRFGGTRRGAFSNRSSSVSAMSPSLASSFTAESEDEFWDGLVIPHGPLDLGERLNRQKQSRSPDRSDPNQIRSPGRSATKIPQQINKQPASPKIASPRRYSPQSPSPKTRSPHHALAGRSQANKDEDDLVSGLDLGEGNIFRLTKSTVHRNVKVKETRSSTNPVRPKAAVSITFTNKPTPPISSRIPRPLASHERSHPPSTLEPVYENGGPAPPPQKPARRAPSRLAAHSAHSAHSSVSSLNPPATPSSTRPPINPCSPPRRRGPKVTPASSRTEPTATTNAQLLRLRRSLPAMRHVPPPPVKPAIRTDRPPSGGGDSRPDPYRPQAYRPRTPVDRNRAVNESSTAQAKKGQVPFLPAGIAHAQSHHVSVKGPRYKRHDSDPEVRPLSRGLSRNMIRSPSPRRSRTEKSTPEPAWQQLNKPRRVRHFGDGHELDVFDDLPTSAQTESRYVKQPIASGIKTNVRNKIYQNVLPDRKTPSPVSPYSPSRADSQPHFARDTAASRIARETSLAQRERVQLTSSLATLASQRVAQLSSRGNIKPLPLLRNRTKKPRKPTQTKPHLISNLSSAKDSKGSVRITPTAIEIRPLKSAVVNGMTYNPSTYVWEGNENALGVFERQSPSPSTTPLPQAAVRDKDMATPRPVLITNINSKKETRRIGDMVFDPQNMCWIKVESTTPSDLQSDDAMTGFTTVEEDDPFRDIPDLEDRTSSGNGTGHASDIREDWLVGEEFDVGPEFVRRQREEEARWRRKCEKWAGKASRSRTDWRWAIRDLVMQGP